MHGMATPRPKGKNNYVCMMMRYTQEEPPPLSLPPILLRCPPAPTPSLASASQEDRGTYLY